MKRQFLTLIIACLCLITLKNGFATSYCGTPPEYTPIELRGTLDLGNGPSRIEAYLYGDFVYVNFNHNYGNVSVSLYNASGLLVYNDVVDTSVQPTVIIPDTGGTSGTYTLVLDSANGYAEGDFERDPQ